jgi:hypothetical protein
MALSTNMGGSVVACARCGCGIAGSTALLDPFAIYCQSCVAITQQEVFSLQKQIEKLTNENKLLKAKQENYDLEFGRARAKSESIEKAYQEESTERLNIRAERDWARNALLFWKSFLDHQKTAKTCPYCSKFEPCPMIKEIETQATSATPQWKCALCEEREAEMAMMQKALGEVRNFLGHEQRCGKCGHAVCDFGKELYRTATKMSEQAASNGGGSRLLAKMNSMIGDFSFLGDNAALMYSRGKYQVIKIDPKKIMVGDVVILSTSDNPKHSVEIAKRHQETMATAHKQEVVK